MKGSTDLTFVTIEEMAAELDRRTEAFVLVAETKDADPRGLPALAWWGGSLDSIIAMIEMAKFVAIRNHLDGRKD